MKSRGNRKKEPTPVFSPGRILITLLLATLLLAGDSSWVWRNAESLTRYGQADDGTITGFARIPDSLGRAIRPELARLGSHSSGLIIAFQTASPEIRIRWSVLHGTQLPHMPLTGVQGLDLYAVDPVREDWNYVGTAKWWKTDTLSHNTTLLENWTGGLRPYALFLPLYDGIDSLFVGVPEEYILAKTSLFDEQSKPVIIYGTSITQGGCASRPGMAYPAILSRRLHHEVLNFGFSGNGRLDPEMADYLATLPASLLVIDALPNVSAEDVEQKLTDFIRRFRSQSNVPLLVIPNISYGHEDDNRETGDALAIKDKAYGKVREMCKKTGIRDVTFISSKRIRFDDDEGTVDGVHLTDLGMKRHADNLYPFIRKIIK
jgi:lysophospholipase L1-like esterase